MLAGHAADKNTISRSIVENFDVNIMLGTLIGIITV